MGVTDYDYHDTDPHVLGLVRLAATLRTALAIALGNAYVMTLGLPVTASCALSMVPRRPRRPAWPGWRACPGFCGAAWRRRRRRVGPPAPPDGRLLLAADADAAPRWRTSYYVSASPRTTSGRRRPAATRGTRGTGAATGRGAGRGAGGAASRHRRRPAGAPAGARCRGRPARGPAGRARPRRARPAPRRPWPVFGPSKAGPAARARPGAEMAGARGRAGGTPRPRRRRPSPSACGAGAAAPGRLRTGCAPPCRGSPGAGVRQHMTRTTMPMDQTSQAYGGRWAAADQLGRRVVGRAGHQAARRRDEAGAPKVAEQGPPRAVDEHVLALDVEVDPAVPGRCAVASATSRAQRRPTASGSGRDRKEKRSPCRASRMTTRFGCTARTSIMPGWGRPPIRRSWRSV